MMGTPPTSMSALGVWSVSGRRRVPSPAARTMASTALLRRGRGARRGPGGGDLRLLAARGPLVLLSVRKDHVDRWVVLVQERRQPLGKVHRAVLPPRAAEVRAERGEAAGEPYA